MLNRVSVTITPPICGAVPVPRVCDAMDATRTLAPTNAATTPGVRFPYRVPITRYPRACTEIVRNVQRSADSASGGTVCARSDGTVQECVECCWDGEGSSGGSGYLWVGRYPRLSSTRQGAVLRSALRARLRPESATSGSAGDRDCAIGGAGWRQRAGCRLRPARNPALVPSTVCCL